MAGVVSKEVVATLMDVHASIQPGVGCHYKNSDIIGSWLKVSGFQTVGVTRFGCRKFVRRINVAAPKHLLLNDFAGELVGANR